MAKVKQEEGKEEVPVEILATAIVHIAEGIKRLRAGRLSDKAILLLIQHACPATYHDPRPTVATICKVLDAMEGLEATYLKKKSSLK